MKKAGIKIAAFVSLLAFCFVLSNFIYTRWFYKADIFEADAKMLLDIDSLQNTCDILYFAESSNATTASTDSCKKSISELIADGLHGVRLGTIQHPAIHAHTYLALIKTIRPESKIRTLIVTMNLRSFGADWINAELETPLNRSEVMYTSYPPIIKRFMLAFLAYDHKEFFQRKEARSWHWKHDHINVPETFAFHSVKEWDAALFSANYQNPQKRDLVCAYVKTYAFSIDTLTNPRIRDFDAIVKVAEQKKLNLVFNLLAENVEYADSLVGKELVQLMEQNRDLLVKRYTGKNVTVVDNLGLVKGKDFLEQDWTSEHYNERGRMQIAAHVLRAAPLCLPENYPNN